MEPLIKLKMFMPVAYGVVTIGFMITAKASPINANQSVGLIITSGSFVLWILSRVQLGNSFTIKPEAKVLVTKGVYSKVRHPVYYFSITALTGVAVYSANVLLVSPVAGLVALQMYRAKKEDGVLLERFKEEYVEYRKTTWF